MHKCVKYYDTNTLQSKQAVYLILNLSSVILVSLMFIKNYDTVNAIKLM